jgi:hypothetical protein
MEYKVFGFNGYGGYRWIGAFLSKKAFLDAVERNGECREFVRQVATMIKDKKEVESALKSKGQIIRSK